MKTDYEHCGPHAPARVLTEPDAGDLKMIPEDVAALRKRVDIVIPVFHWGVIWVPRVIADYQVTWRMPASMPAQIWCWATMPTCRKRVSGEAGGDQGDLSQPKSDAQISEKFLGTAGEFFGAARARTLLDRLWALEKIERVAEIPASFVKG